MKSKDNELVAELAAGEIGKMFLQAIIGVVVLVVTGLVWWAGY